MARPLRVEYPDAIYHVTSRGNGRQAIVLDDGDRDRWMRVLDRVVTGYRWRIFSFVLMDNHYHLFLQTPEPNLSRGMQEINGSFAAYFNTRHRRPGHLFQGRFKALVVEDEGHWDVLSRYIHLNPVRAGLVARPEEWTWSSFRGYDRVKARVRWVDYGRILGEFGGDNTTGRRRYGDFVTAGLQEESPLSPLSSAAYGLILGSEQFQDRIAQMISSRSEDPDLPQLNHLRPRPPVTQVVQAVADYYKADISRWQGRCRDNGLPRAIAAYVARQVTRESLSSVGRVLGYQHVSGVRAAYRRAEQAMKNKRTAKEVNKLIQKIA